MLATMPRKKKPLPPVDSDEIVTMSFRAEAWMAKIIDDLAEEHRHTRSVALLILVEKALKAEGLWPKKPK